VRNLLTVLAAIATAALLGGWIANSIVMPRLVQHDKTVQVPSVVGMPLAAARAVATSAGLQLVEDGHAHSDSLPAGSVVRQQPAAATAVKQGRGLRVTTSLGQERVSVPDLRGQTTRQAALQLANASLVLGSIARVRSGTADETVRATSPHAGSEAALGDSVAVLMTLGVAPGPWFVPSLVGQELADVRALLEARGFVLGRVTQRGVRGVFPGTVLEQYPPRGSWIRRGEAIDLVVANPE
jgi:serine/threonine-protein kinase